MTPHQLFERISAYVPQIVAALPVALAVVVGAMILNMVLGRMLKLLARRTSLTDADILPIRHILRWLLRLVALILILGVFGFELGGLWAMISTVLGLIAIGFVAVWSLLSNASSTVLILFLRPFQIGDDVEIAGEPVSGRVIDINFFYTTLIDADGRLLQVPNNLFFQKTLKRRRNQPGVSLAQQLNSPRPADLPPPPPRPEPPKPAPEKTAEPNPLMSMPDPATLRPTTSNRPGA